MPRETFRGPLSVEVRQFLLNQAGSPVFGQKARVLFVLLAHSWLGDAAGNALDLHADGGDGRAVMSNVSTSTITAATNMQQPHVYRALRALCDSKVLTCIRRGGGAGDRIGRPAVYLICT